MKAIIQKSCRSHIDYLQANAIGLASVAMSSHMDLIYWCGEIIDRVIKSGNNLYIESAIGELTV